MNDERNTANMSQTGMERSDSPTTSSVNNGPTGAGPDSSQVEDEYEQGTTTPMSPRRPFGDTEALGRGAREEMRRHAQALQESLLNIFNRIEAVKEEHDKLDSHNKFLQKYIGDLMSTSKITASGSRSKK